MSESVPTQVDLYGGGEGSSVRRNEDSYISTGCLGEAGKMSFRCQVVVMLAARVPTERASLDMTKSTTSLDEFAGRDLPGRE